MNANLDNDPFPVFTPVCTFLLYAHNENGLKKYKLLIWFDKC